MKDGMMSESIAWASQLPNQQAFAGKKKLSGARAIYFILCRPSHCPTAQPMPKPNPPTLHPSSTSQFQDRTRSVLLPYQNPNAIHLSRTHFSTSPPPLPCPMILSSPYPSTSPPIPSPPLPHKIQPPLPSPAHKVYPPSLCPYLSSPISCVAAGALVRRVARG